MAETTRIVKLAARPVGEPKPSDFEVAEVPIPEAGDGELLVRNTWMSVDPYMRGRMREGPQYAAPFEIGKVMFGGAVGEVVSSNAPGFSAGDTVSHQLGWREQTDEARLFGYARSLASESDFFIRKAIGWALRDYARHAPEAVSGFLSASRDLISPLTVREASKHLPSIR